MYVNLNNIKYNLENIKKLLHKDTSIIAMVKANAYGLGDVEVSKFLQQNGINFFGVAYVKEGVKLRHAGISSNILVTSQFLEENICDIINNNISISISSLENLDKLNKLAKEQNTIVNAHIKIETGMRRLGFNLEDLKESVNKILSFSNINIEGIYTHLSSADSDFDYTNKQLQIFKEAIDILKKSNITPKYIHCLNSSGILNFPEFQFNTVRIGDILYGYYPDSSLIDKIDLKPCVKLTAKIIHIQDYPEKSKISYNQTCTLDKPSKIATVQMGYADGLFRCLSNNYSVKINNSYCKILGNICMDMFMCDITDIKNVKIGDEVTILDYDNSIYEMSNLCSTINYEIISKITDRVERKYI